MRLYTGLLPPTEKSADKFDRFNTDFAWNSFLGETNGTETFFYSIGHNLNLMFDLPFSKTSRFGIGIGFGYGHFSIRHDGEFTFPNDPSGSGEKYSLLATYPGPNRWINRTAFNILEIPFEFRIRAQRERGKFKFYPGFKVGYIGGNYHKWVVDGMKYKEYNFPDLNRLHYGPTLRIGVDNFMLFGYYDLTYLFTNPNSNKLQLFSLGISIGWF